MTAVGDGGRLRAISCNSGESFGGVLCGWCWHTCNMSAWTVGDSQGCGLSYCVGFGTLHDGSGNWAVRRQNGHSVGGSNPNRRNPGGIANRWGDVRVRNTSSRWLGDASNVGAWAVSDCDSLALGSSVSMSSVREGGGSWAVGGVDVSGDGGCNVSAVPAIAPGSGSSDEAEGSNEGLEGLHLDKNECGVWNERRFVKFKKQECLDVLQDNARTKVKLLMVCRGKGICRWEKGEGLSKVHCIAWRAALSCLRGLDARRGRAVVYLPTISRLNRNSATDARTPAYIEVRVNPHLPIQSLPIQRATSASPQPRRHATKHFDQWPLVSDPLLSANQRRPRFSI